jgi:DNA-binding transcriptional LysR family regulator
MELNQLIAFERVVREGGFGRAALALSLGQPAVSARIHALEEELGGALVHRGRRIALTPLGESVLPYARRVVELVAETAEAARLAHSGGRGRVRLGALGSLAGGLVGPALAELLLAQPDTECFVKSGDHEAILGHLWDGLVELAIVAWPSDDPLAAELTALLVFEEPVVLVARRDHPLAKRGSARRRARAEVTEDDLVRHGRPIFQLRWWQHHHPRLARLAQASESRVELPMETARQLVMGGVGVGFFAKTYVAEDLERDRLIELEVRGLAVTRGSALVRRRRSLPLSPTGAALVQAIAAQAARLGLLGGRRARAGARAG